MENLNLNYMLGIYIWLGLYHKYDCTLWSFKESGYYSILTNVEVNGMQISSTYINSSCNRDISKIYWPYTLNITKHPTPISFSALLLVIADGEEKKCCINLKFVSPGLIIINNRINPTQTHYISKVAVDIWVLCLQ